MNSHDLIALTRSPDIAIVRRSAVQDGWGPRRSVGPDRQRAVADRGTEPPRRRGPLLLGAVVGLTWIWGAGSLGMIAIDGFFSRFGGVLTSHVRMAALAAVGCGLCLVSLLYLGLIGRAQRSCSQARGPSSADHGPPS